MLTPNEIEVLLHYHVSTAAHPRGDAMAVRTATGRFLRDGIILPIVQGVHPLPAPGRGPHMTTPKGAALVKMLCSTPYPIEHWADPRTGQVIEDPYATTDAATPTTCDSCGVHVGVPHLATCAPALAGQPFTPLIAREVQP